MLDIINTYIFGPGLCISVFGTGILFLIYLRGFFIIKPKAVLSALKSGGGDGLTPLKAMIIALSGTLGVGNIVGVASAIAIGGPGSVFWMLISTLAALPIKYAETVLAVKHSRRDSKGIPHGGAWFYISDLKSHLGKITAAVFAFLCLATSLTMGCAVQSNAIAVSLYSTFGIPPLASGLFLALVTLAVASGGFKRIASVTVRLIPAMSAVYIAMSLFIITTNLGMLPTIVSEIIADAFSQNAIGGGIIGFLTCRSLRIGVTRGIVSNEAGCGTAPIAHAGAKSTTPAAQGVFGMAEVFIDTAVICTLTALSVLIAEKHGITLTVDGMACANAVFGRFIPLAGMILACAVFVFAFCSMICWFFYGTESLSYLTNNKRIHTLYLLVFSVCALAGSVGAHSLIWSLSDLTVSLMTTINVAVLLLYAKEIRKETDFSFFRKNNVKNKDITKFE